MDEHQGLGDREIDYPDGQPAHESYRGPRWTYELLPMRGLGMAPGWVLGTVRTMPGPPTRGAVDYPRELTEAECERYELRLIDAPCPPDCPDVPCPDTCGAGSPPPTPPSGEPPRGCEAEGREIDGVRCWAGTPGANNPTASTPPQCESG